VPALNSLYKQYRDRAEFYIVYIQEAHPVDAWQMDVNVKDGALLATTKTLEDRTAAAGTCLIKTGLALPALVDTPDDFAERAYTGWPDRLYVVDTNGRIAFKSAAGPFGFKPADVETTLKRLLSEGNTNRASNTERERGGGQSEDHLPES
jgi:type I thyroxine 5'-deiodinase